MRIIFLTLIVWFIAPNSFANENIDKINSFGKKIDNCREIFLKEKDETNFPLMKYYKDNMQVHEDLQKCYIDVATEIFEIYYTDNKKLMFEKINSYIKDTYEYNILIYYNSNHCKNNCGLLGYLYAKQATSYDLQNYLIRMLSQLEVIYGN